MTPERDRFLQHLRATFRDEASEHLMAIGQGLLELEKNENPILTAQIVEMVFREAHSLKGAARAVEFNQIEGVCHELEETFSSWKRLESSPSAASLGQMHAKVDAITHFLAAATPQASQKGGDSGPPQTASAQEGTALAPPSGSSHDVAAALTTDNTVRVSVALLDAVLIEIGELISAKLDARQRVDDLRALAQVASTANVYTHPQPITIANKCAGYASKAERDSDALDTQIDDLLETSKKLLLLPLSTITWTLQKLVRDLSRDQGKEAELRIEGDHIEIDRQILEEIKNPLIHLLRNAVDHGIEAPVERSNRGKPPLACIRLEVSQTSGNKLQLVVRDDGAGIDTSKVAASAAKRGMLSLAQVERMTSEEMLALVFRSDVSTREIMTPISGRGLGLAIVREKVERLGGDVSVESRLGLGTVFRMVVPSLRTTFRGILVEAEARLLVLPTTDVQRAVRVRSVDVRTIEGRETIALDGRVLPLVRLAEVLELPPRPPLAAPTQEISLLILGAGDHGIAYAVSAVLGEQEMLVRPLPPPLSRVCNVSGTALLGDGRVAPILRVADLLRSEALNSDVSPRWTAASPVLSQKSVLVAEDSITSRMLIRGFLETAGYRVVTAVDGLDAFAKLRAEPFDLLVSDVEMPQLNGFDLTARIRADPGLGKLPVVLLTSLEGVSDRERGIDVGASAYITKSHFDQNTLIATVRRLV